jgi:hypothetical protein
VNLSVIVYYLRNRGGARMSPVHFLLLPALGAVVCVYLLCHLDSHAIVLGFAWAALGVCLLAYLTGGFTRQPPEVAIDEAETVGVAG